MPKFRASYKLLIYIHKEICIYVYIYYIEIENHASIGWSTLDSKKFWNFHAIIFASPLLLFYFIMSQDKKIICVFILSFIIGVKQQTKQKYKKDNNQHYYELIKK